jgi:hypothetical protein
MATRDALIAAYLRTREENSDADFWAYEEMTRLHKENPTEAVDLTFALIEACQSEGELSYIVAGPVEDLLWSGNKEHFATFAAACERSPRVLRAMSMLAWAEEDPLYTQWQALLAKHGVRSAMTPNNSFERTREG